MKDIPSSFLFFVFLFFPGLGFAQTVQERSKPRLDTGAFSKWTSVDNAVISNNGKYVVYTIKNQPAGKNTLVVRSIGGVWKKELIGGNSALFIESSEKIVMLQDDGLCIITLGTDKREDISNVQSYQLFMRGNREYLLYHSSNKSKELVIQDFATGEKNLYNGVERYVISRNGGNLLVQTKSSGEKVSLTVLTCFYLETGKSKKIWEGEKISNCIFDDSGTQIAFIVEDINQQKSIWYCKNDWQKAELFVENATLPLGNNFTLFSISPQGFNKDGDLLFFQIQEKQLPSLGLEPVKVDVWSYQDNKLQSQQLYEVKPKNYTAVINVNTNHIICLQKENEAITFYESNDQYAFIIGSEANENERNWNEKAKRFAFLINTRTGVRIQVPYQRNESISPSGRFGVFQHLNKRDYYCFDFFTGRQFNFTKSLPIPKEDVDYDRPDPIGEHMSIASWLDNDSTMLFFDKYDLWSINLFNKRSAYNITNSYGRKNKIVFGLLKDFKGRPVKGDKQLILTAFDRVTKNNGFYSKNLADDKDPQELSMGAFFYSVRPDYAVEIFNSFNPIKARDANVYIVCRETASSSPNYFWTTDFEVFKPLSINYPEAKYNWLRTELHTWKSFSGKVIQGVLYKPENFDPSLKYPIIFHYYEKVSFELNLYKQPDYISNNINIPWFVSHGYLVFTPDIHYTVGKPGESAYSAIVSAAEYLKEIPWIDSAKMGLQGHSFGGFETNYLLTRTSFFSAAMASAAPSDFISGYGGLRGDGESRQYFYELHQSRIGRCLWQTPELYIENSPVLYAYNVNTPLLMMNNKGDEAVPFSQGVELFTALRRLGKRAWLLQYDNGFHSLYDKSDLKDYTIRITQFFDHYLKDSACPRWMLYGIPAKDKGIDNGYELVKEKDPETGKWLTPKEGGLLTDEEKKKVEALKRRKPVTVTID